MCFKDRKNGAGEPEQPAKLTIIYTPPPPEFPEHAAERQDEIAANIEAKYRPKKSPTRATAMELHPGDARPWTPTHNKRASRGTAPERNRLSDVDPHEVHRVSYGDLGTRKLFLRRRTSRNTVPN